MVVFVAFLTAVVALGFVNVALLPETNSAVAAPSGTAWSRRSGDILKRKPWITSRVHGSPEPSPPFVNVRRFPELRFERPLLVRGGAGDGRIWVVEQGGKVFSFVDNDSVNSPDLFVDLAAEYERLTLHAGAAGVDSVYGLAFHPRYPDVPYCWIAYTLRSTTSGQHLEDGTRLSRFRVSFDAENRPHCEAASERVLLTWLEGGHNGACLEFGPDGYLYVSAGDGEVPNPPDPRDAGQDVSNLLSTVMRLDVSITDDAPWYRVPSDNPFFDVPDARPEIWSFGYRNPWKMSFAPDGELWLGDVGWELFEMVHRVRRGSNGGWSIMEGPQPVRPQARRGPAEITPAAIALPHTDAASVTGGYVYRGTQFPELVGTYVFGDYETRRMWSAKFDAERVMELTELVEPAVRLVAFGEDTQHELLMLDYEGGTLHGLERAPPEDRTHEFPMTLSETGLFKDGDLTIPAEGVVRFHINAAMWSDGAHEDLFLAVPGMDRIEVQKSGVRRNNWMLREQMFFPRDSVLARTVSLSDTKQQQINLETQLLHFNGSDWKGYTYIWRPDMSDADLAPASGGELTLADYGEFAGDTPTIWRVHSRAECQRCHNHWAGGPLAFTLPQLNRDQFGEAATDESVNQLIALREGGWLTGAVPENPESSREDYARPLSHPRAGDKGLDARARSWLSANCSHCHQNGAGGTATIDLLFTTPLEKMGLVRKQPVLGSFGLSNAALVVPGRPEHSVLFYRVATAGRGHMPHIGATLPDPQGVKLIAEWIESLAPATDPAPAAASVGDIPELFGGTSSALRWLLRLTDGQAAGEARERLLSVARQSPPDISGLFERFQPRELRREIRQTIDANAVLALTGDGAIGRELFFSRRLQCATCHQIAGEGKAVGPALDDVGRRQTRAQILESLLEPSRTVDRKFASWTAVLADGRAVSGLLVSRSEDLIVLRNVLGEDVSLPVSDVDELQPQATSLMPDRQLNELSDQEIASLVEFLHRRQHPVPPLP
jgi:putative heme-binding domain-containing protein